MRIGLGQFGLVMLFCAFWGFITDQILAGVFLLIVGIVTLYIWYERNK